MPISGPALAPARNLADLVSAQTARANLGDDGVVRPQDHGLIAWSGDPAALRGVLLLPTAGQVNTVRLKLGQAYNVTSILLATTTTATLTAGQCFAGIYQGGTLLGVTSDQATAWQTSGLKTMALVGGPIACAAGDVIVAFYANGSPLPTFACGSNTGFMINAGLAAASSRWGTADTGRTTSLPATLGTIAQGSSGIWTALA